jgi:hypothetical protein
LEKAETKTTKVQEIREKHFKSNTRIIKNIRAASQEGAVASIIGFGNLYRKKIARIFQAKIL